MRVAASPSAVLVVDPNQHQSGTSKRRWWPEGNRVPLAGAADAGPSTSPWRGREAASVWQRCGCRGSRRSGDWIVACTR